MRKKSFSILITFLIITVLVAAAPAFADNYIVGGKRVGPVMLGQPVSKYKTFLGPRKTLNPKFFQYPKKGMALLVKNGIIEGIMVYSRDYKTKKGVKVGHPIRALKKHYGNYLKTDAGSLVYTELGLSFLEAGGKISKIMVVQATPDPLLGDKKIIPGVRAGALKIGMNIDTVTRYWGKPDSTGALKNKRKVLIYKYDRKGVQLLVTEGILAGARINSYKFQTPEGIGINSTREQVIKTYGPGFKEVGDSIMYKSLGIGFYFNNGKVMEIFLTYRKS